MDPSAQVYYFDDFDDQNRSNTRLAANQTLASGISSYYSPAGSRKISTFRPAGSGIYDSRPDLAAFSTAVSHSCLHKHSHSIAFGSACWLFVLIFICIASEMDCERSSLISGNTEYGTPPSTSPILTVPMSIGFNDVSRSDDLPPSSLYNANRQVAGHNIDGFYSRAPDRPNYNSHIFPNPRQLPVNSSNNSVVDGLDFAHPQSVDTNGPAYYNKPRFMLNADLKDIDQHRGELSANEKYRYDLSRAQLKATSRTSALLAGFAMVALVELQYDEGIDKGLLIVLGVVTTLLVSVHLIALMMSTCLLPHIEANGCTQDSPHNRLHFYIELSWLLSICIGLLLFLLEIGVIFFVKFDGIDYRTGAYITSALLVPVFIAFVVISYLLHRDRFSHSVDRVNTKVGDLENIIEENSNPTHNLQKQIINVGLVKQLSMGKVSLEWLSEWPPEMILKLFQLVKPHPYLYDQNHSSFHNRTLKGQTWTSIAKSLDRRLTSKRCRDRFVLYRRRYMSLMRKQMKKGQNTAYPEFNWLLKAFDDADHSKEEKDEENNTFIVSDEAESVAKEDTPQNIENDDSVMELMKALTKKINEKIPISQAPILSHDALAESIDETYEDKGSLITKIRGFSDTESEQELQENSLNEQLDLMALINQIINIPQQDPADEECDLVGKLFALDLRKLNKDNRLLALNCVAAILNTLLASQTTGQLPMDTS